MIRIRLKGSVFRLSPLVRTPLTLFGCGFFAWYQGYYSTRFSVCQVPRRKKLQRLAFAIEDRKGGKITDVVALNGLAFGKNGDLSDDVTARHLHKLL